MKETDIRKIEAWFDGEATPGESRQVESLLKDDPQAKAYLEQLEASKKLLQGAHVSTSQPPEWGEVKQRAGRLHDNPARKVVSFPRAMAAAAAIVLIGMALWIPMRKAGMEAVPAVSLYESVDFVETDLEGATPVVYLDQPSGWTVVWVVEEPVDGGT
jgi:anti-sigma factor RsiW